MSRLICGLRKRPFDFYWGGGRLLWPWIFFSHSVAWFYFGGGTVQVFFLARIMGMKQNKNVYYISVDSDLVMDKILIKSLVL